MTQTLFTDRNKNSIYAYHKVFNPKGDFFIVLLDDDLGWVIENLVTHNVERLTPELAAEMKIWNGDLYLTSHLNYLKQV